MNKKIILSSAMVCLLTAPAIAQEWGTMTGIPTWTSGNVWIGFPDPTVTPLPTGSTTHIRNVEFTNVAGTSDANLRINRTVTSMGMGNNPHVSGNLVEAIVEDLNAATPPFKGFVLNKDFELGIGTSSPSERLNVHDGHMAMSMTDDTKARNIYGTTTRSLLGFYAKKTVKDGPGIELHGSGYSEPGSIKFTSFGKPAKIVFGKWNTTNSTLERHIVIDEVGDINMVRWHDDASERKIMGNSEVGGLELYSNGYDNDGTGIQMFARNHDAFKGSIHFIANEQDDPKSAGFEFVNYKNNQFNSLMTILKNGNVGIGDQNPVAKLTVDGEFNFTPNPNAVRMIRGRTDKYMEIYSNYNTDDGSGLFMMSSNSSFDPGAIWANSMGAADNSNSFVIRNHTGGGSNDNLVKVLKNGKVIMGDVPSPDGYRLFVKDGILAEKVRVAISTTVNWADFVFDDDYKLMPLEDVESYIEANNHLPEIPTTEDVLKDGIDVAQMNARLLQKVEELTLYIIEQNKRVSELEKKVNAKK